MLHSTTLIDFFNVHYQTTNTIVIIITTTVYKLGKKIFCFVLNTFITWAILLIIVDIMKEEELKKNVYAYN